MGVFERLNFGGFIFISLIELYNLCFKVLYGRF